MSLYTFLLFLLIGGIDLYIIYKKEGKTKVVGVCLIIYSAAMILGLLTLLDLVKRNFSNIMDFWY